MAINKVNYGGQTLIDTSEDTAEAGDVLAGQTFHSKSGLQSTGTLVLPDNKNVWYGTCDTAGGTSAKIVTTSSEDFVLTIGNMVRVKFSNGNTYDGTATLNVDGKGAVNITRIGTTTTTRYFWQPGEVVDFVYDGTNFVMSQRGVGTTNYYGVTKLSDSTSSTSTTLAATANAVKTVYDLANGKQNKVTYSTTDLTPGTSSLTTGNIYVVYE